MFIKTHDFQSSDPDFQFPWKNGNNSNDHVQPLRKKSPSKKAAYQWNCHIVPLVILLTINWWT